MRRRTRKKQFGTSRQVKDWMASLRAMKAREAEAANQERGRAPTLEPTTATTTADQWLQTHLWSTADGATS